MLNMTTPVNVHSLHYVENRNRISQHESYYVWICKYTWQLMSKHTTFHVACDGIPDLILEFNCKE